MLAYFGFLHIFFIGFHKIFFWKMFRTWKRVQLPSNGRISHQTRPWKIIHNPHLNPIAFNPILNIIDILKNVVYCILYIENQYLPVKSRKIPSEHVLCCWRPNCEMNRSYNFIFDLFPVLLYSVYVYCICKKQCCESKYIIFESGFWN